MTALRLQHPVALVGMPGVGKTTVGRLLAERLALPFGDSDEEVERTTGMTVAQLFERDGEAKFRALECAAIDKLLDGTPLVLATGGGAMANASSRALLLDRAETVWLDASAEVLVARLAGTNDHPLLTGVLPKGLQAMEAARTRFYTLATHRVMADESPEVVTAAVLAKLKANSPHPPAAPAR